MSISVVQFKVAEHVGTNPNVVTFDNPLTAGNSIIVVVEYYHNTAGPLTTVFDSAGNTPYNKEFGPFDSGTDLEGTFEVWRCPSIGASGAGVVVTGTPPNAVVVATIWVFEVQSTTTLAKDKSVTHLTASSTTGNTGTTPQTTYTNELLIAFGGPSGNPVTGPPPSPWTDAGIASGGTGSDCAFRVVTSTGTYTTDFTEGTNEWWAGIVTFGETGAAGGDIVSITGKYQLR